MPQREFEITVGPDGHVQVHISGYKGKGCIEAARMFEEIVGKMHSRQETAEFYQPEENVRIHIERRQ
jgi:hypothetical protein